MFDKFPTNGQAKRNEKTTRIENLQGRYFVQSLERGLAVIRAFGAENPVLTTSDVARRADRTITIRDGCVVSHHEPGGELLHPDARMPAGLHST